jgi:hypothetical protein
MLKITSFTSTLLKLITNEIGAVGDEVIEPLVEPVAEVKPVSTEAYEQTKNDMHKFKRQLTEESNARLMAEKKLQDFETEQQESKGNYKELYEARTEELETYKGKYDSVLDNVVNDKKLTAVRELALKHNIRQEALDDLDMVDMSKVVVETTDQGRYNVLGADIFVDSLKQLKPHWFTDARAPVLNNGVGTFDDQSKTYSGAELLALQKKDPALYADIINKKQNLIRRN